MPIREYKCPAGHLTEKLEFGQYPPQKKICPTCDELHAVNPMFNPTVEMADLVEISSTFVPSADFKSAEARRKWKAGAHE